MARATARLRAPGGSALVRRPDPSDPPTSPSVTADRRSSNLLDPWELPPFGRSQLYPVPGPRPTSERREPPPSPKRSTREPHDPIHEATSKSPEATPSPKPIGG